MHRAHHARSRPFFASSRAFSIYLLAPSRRSTPWKVDFDTSNGTPFTSRL
jgi:hypothetical protein